MGGKELGVGQSEQGAVGLTHVGELAVTESLAQAVHVAGHVDGAHVGQQGGDGVLAVTGELAESGDGGFDLCRRARRGIRRDVRLARSRVAFDGVASLHATRIEHDDVEVVEDARGQGAQFVRDVVEPGNTRTAGVDNE